MRLSRSSISFLAAVGLAASPLATAKVSPEEAAKLGKELTAVGAIQAGNADGTIPEWVGAGFFTEQDMSITPKQLEELRTTKVDEIDKMFKRAALTAGEDALKPLFTITKANMAEYKDKLTVGQIAMLERFDGMSIPVYKSLRTAFFPEKVYEETIANASRAELKGDDVIIGAEIGFPFPIPKKGAEVIWNHKLKYRLSTLHRIINEALVSTDGTYQISKTEQAIELYYANLKPDTPEDMRSTVFAIIMETLSPPDIAGQRLMAIEEMDQDKGGRKLFLFTEGVGLREVPKAGYDTPLPNGFGEMYADQADMFNGQMDRYEWKLVGRQEKYIAYNSYLLNDPRKKYKEILTPYYVNRDLARYELHRVWVVEANLREGTTHQIKRRTFYVDEDSWSIAAVDCYDNQDKLWKYQEAYLLTLPFLKTVSGVPEAYYDLQSGRYFISSLTTEEGSGDWTVEWRKRFFSPRTLKKPKIFK